MFRVVVVLLVVVSLAVSLAALVSRTRVQTVTVTVGAPVGLGLEPRNELRAAGGCGTERAAVKHLTDGFALPAEWVTMTPDDLVSLKPPPVTASSPRFPVERQVVVLTNVHVIAAKQEADSDLHVILAVPGGGEMNVEEPRAQCDATSPEAAVLAQARRAMDAAMPNVSSAHYTPENLTATIEGVLFFDVLHGQRGAANGVELHPITFFAVAPPPAP